MTQERPFESVLGEPSASFETQYRAATSSVVVLDRSHLTRVAALGADRENFLQNMLSADVKATPESYGRRACFLTNKGKLVSDLTVFKEAERFVLEMEANRAAPFVEALSRYIISEDVTLRNLEAVDASFSLEGPDAAVLVARITGAPPDTIEGLEHLATRGAGEATIIAHRNAPSPRFDVVAAPERARALARLAIDGGAVRGGERLAETRRIEAGRPRFGIDMDESHIPLEAGLDEAISFDKGCYIGQETIVRIAHRGHVNRKLSGILLDGSTVPARGATVSAEGRDVGAMTSGAISPALGGVVSLAYLKPEISSPGTQVEVENRPGRVASLPFLASR